MFVTCKALKKTVETLSRINFVSAFAKAISLPTRAIREAAHKATAQISLGAAYIHRVATVERSAAETHALLRGVWAFGAVEAPRPSDLYATTQSVHRSNLKPIDER